MSIFYPTIYQMIKWYSLNKSISPEEFDLCKELESLIYDNDVIMKEIFDDHAFIILTADGSNVSEYDHD